MLDFLFPFHIFLKKMALELAMDIATWTTLLKLELKIIQKKKTTRTFYGWSPLEQHQTIAKKKIGKKRFPWMIATSATEQKP
jgi:hypothetical protein